LGHRRSPQATEFCRFSWIACRKIWPATYAGNFCRGRQPPKNGGVNNTKVLPNTNQANMFWYCEILLHRKDFRMPFQFIEGIYLFTWVCQKCIDCSQNRLPDRSLLTLPIMWSSIAEPTAIYINLRIFTIYVWMDSYTICIIREECFRQGLIGSPGPGFIKQDQGFYKPKFWKNSNGSKTCNVAAACLTFCDKQQGYTLLLVTKSQACGCNIAGFIAISKI